MTKSRADAVLPAQSLRVVQGVQRLRFGLLVLSGIVIVGAPLLGLLLPTHPWPSVLGGMMIALAIYGTTYWTTVSATGTEALSIGPVAADYLIKAALVVVALVAAKHMEIFNLREVAGIVGFAVLTSMIVQLWAFSSPNRSQYHS